MDNLGISRGDLVRRTLEEFKEDGASEEVVQVRFKFYQNRMM